MFVCKFSLAQCTGLGSQPVIAQTGLNPARFHNLGMCLELYPSVHQTFVMRNIPLLAWNTIYPVFSRWSPHANNDANTCGAMFRVLRYKFSLIVVKFQKG